MSPSRGLILSSHGVRADRATLPRPLRHEPLVKLPVNGGAGQQITVCHAIYDPLVGRREQ